MNFEYFFSSCLSILLTTLFAIPAIANPCDPTLIPVASPADYYEAHWPEYRDSDKAKLSDFFSQKPVMKRFKLASGRVLILKEGTYQQADQLHVVAHEPYSVPSLAIGREKTSRFIFISSEDAPDEPLGYYFLSWYPEGKEHARDLSEEIPTVAEAKLIYVAPHARNTHVGSILFALASLDAIADSRTDILISHVANNKIASILQKLGIEPSGKSKSYGYPVYRTDIRQDRSNYRELFLKYLSQYAREEAKN